MAGLVVVDVIAECSETLDETGVATTAVAVELAEWLVLGAVVDDTSVDVDIVVVTVVAVCIVAVVTVVLDSNDVLDPVTVVIPSPPDDAVLEASDADVVLAVAALVLKSVTFMVIEVVVDSAIAEDVDVTADAAADVDDAIDAAVDVDVDAAVGIDAVADVEVAAVDVEDAVLTSAVAVTVEVDCTVAVAVDVDVGVAPSTDVDVTVDVEATVEVATDVEVTVDVVVVATTINGYSDQERRKIAILSANMYIVDPSINL